MRAADEENPLGPGVSRDTRVTESGMVQKAVGEDTIVVPADEVVRAI